MKVNERKRSVPSKSARAASKLRANSKSRVTVDPSLNKYAGKDTTPEKTAFAKEHMASALAAVATFRAGVQFSKAQ